MNTEIQFNLNKYFQSLAQKIEIKLHPPFAVRSVDDKKKYYHIKSLDIKISTPIDDVNKQIKDAILSMELSAQAIVNMGIEIKIEDISWHNIQERSYNIFDNIGFFVLSFTRTDGL